MFELPDAKRVRRENLYDSESEEEPISLQDDAEAQARLKERLASMLSFDVAAPLDGPDLSEQQPPAAESEEVFEFRLFGGAPAAKVVLAPEPAAANKAAAQECGFVVPRRPLSYYLARKPTSEEEERWRLSAVTGEEVVARSAQRCWGLEKPWRVIRIVVPAQSGSQKQRKAGAQIVAPAGEKKGLDATTGVDAASKKTRPGKRRRIALRIKAKAAKEAQEKLAEAEKVRVTKEEHLSEKKKRLNREKKLKRRQKEREKKQAAGGVTGGGEEKEGSGDDGSDGD